MNGIQILKSRLLFPINMFDRGPRGVRGYRGITRGVSRGSAYFAGYRPTRRPR